MRKGILFIPISYNADSMQNIINILFCDELCREKNLPLVDKITFLVTADFSSTIVFRKEEIPVSAFLDHIRNELKGDCVEIRQRMISNYAKDIPRVIMDGIKEAGKDAIIIDLTCGKKDITGSLYTTASISQIRNMVYIDVPRFNGVFPEFTRDYASMKGKFTLTRYESMDEIENLASLNEMGFIYYKKNIQEIRPAIPDSKVELYCDQIERAVEKYFSEKDSGYRDAIRELGLINEELMPALGKALHEKYAYLGLKPFKPERSMDTIRELEGRFLAKGTKPEELQALREVFDRNPAIFEMLEILRIYRNRSSHDGGFLYKKEDVKLLIDILMLIFGSLMETGLADDIWRGRE